MLFSHRCPICSFEQSDYNICSSCFSSLRFLNNACKKCQEPFDYAVEGIDICQKCTGINFYSQMKCPLVYNEFSKNIIMRFKNNSDFLLRDIFAKFILNIAKDFFQDAIIIPVPLFSKRLIWRGYNQSIVLSNKLSQLSGSQVIKEGIIRIKDTNIAESKTIKERMNKVASAFEVNPFYKNFFRNKKIVIVDDVITTGATVFECAKAMEVKEINIVAIARRLKKF